MAMVPISRSFCGSSRLMPESVVLYALPTMTRAVSSGLRPSMTSLPLAMSFFLKSACAENAASTALSIEPLSLPSVLPNS